MHNQKIRRLLGGAAAIGLAVAVAGCARDIAQPQPANPYPPPAAGAPPPAYGSASRPQWANPTNTATRHYSVIKPLHLRTAPGVNSMIIGTLPRGTRVQATGSLQGGWWEVQSPNGTGWVSSHYLSPT